MGKKGARESEVCRNLCVYHKPGQSKDLSCLGSLLVEALVAKRRDLILTQRPGKATAMEGMLVQMMCKRCPFHPEDCDYILKKGKAAPCGGFLALSGFLHERIITIDGIRDGLDRLF